MAIRQESPEQITTLTEEYNAEIDLLAKNIQKDFIYSTVKLRNDKEGKMILIRNSFHHSHEFGNTKVNAHLFFPHYAFNPLFYYNERVSQFDNRTPYEREIDNVYKEIEQDVQHFQENFLYIIKKYGDRFTDGKRKKLMENYQKLQVILENRSIDFKKQFKQNAEMALKQAPKLERQRIKLWYNIPKTFGEGAVDEVLNAFCAYMEGRFEEDKDVEIKFIKKLESMSGVTKSPLTFINDREKEVGRINYGVYREGLVETLIVDMKRSILKHQIEYRRATMTNPDYEFKKINQTLNKPYREGSDKLKGKKQEDYLINQRYVLLMNSIDYIDED